MTNEELEQIYNEAYRAVYWTAMSLLKNEADAEDIVQDTFVAFIESYADIKDTRKATALLKKIAANKCFDRIKLARTDNVEDEFFENAEAVPEDFLPDTIIESAEMRKIVIDIINNSLSEDIRRTLILFYFDEMSTKEIAETLGIPQGTVLWRLNFAKKKIKKEVEKYEEDNDTKLFGMALPFLSKLFMKEAEQVPYKPMPAKLVSLSASTQVSHAEAATKATASLAKKGTGIVINKALIGCAVGFVTLGAGVGIILSILSKSADNEPTVTTSSVEKTITSTENAVTTDMPIQSNAETSTSDPNSIFDPDARVFEQMPRIYGKNISFACTIGELKAKGFEFVDDGKVEDGTVMMTISDDIDDNEYAFLCHLQNPDQQNGIVSNNAVVLAIEIYMLETDLDFYDIRLDMPEREFINKFGSPAYVIGNKTDRTFYYYFLDDKGNVYEFCFVNTTNNPDDAKLMSLTYGTRAYMCSRAPLCNEI